MFVYKRRNICFNFAMGAVHVSPAHYNIPMCDITLRFADGYAPTDVKMRFVRKKVGKHSVSGKLIRKPTPGGYVLCMKLTIKSDSKYNIYLKLRIANNSPGCRIIADRLIGFFL